MSAYLCRSKVFNRLNRQEHKEFWLFFIRYVHIYSPNGIKNELLTVSDIRCPEAILH